MEFRILGPLEVRDGERSVPLRGGKPRALLGALLLHPNEPVSMARLIDDLWGEEPPASAEKLVQGYVHALRKALGSRALVTHAPGYRADVEPHTLDALEFRRLVAEARAARGGQALALRERALALWRGDALCDTDLAGLDGQERARLDELRLETRIERIEDELALGWHDEVIGELESLLHAHPYRERLHARLALALYRAGRQAEALEACRRARATLADELGLEPGEELRELQTAILRQDPSLMLHPEPTIASARPNLPAPPRRVMTAREGDVFIGRALELEELERVLAGARAGSGATVLVAGDAGIGKTRLAAELAGRARAAGLEVLLGRSLDLIGTELAYQPFIEALRPLGDPRQVQEMPAGSQLRVFETTLALLSARAHAVPVLLVLEDVHWADTSTLDLTVYLAHNLDSQPVVLLATYRAGEAASAGRMSLLADRVRRSGAALVLELGPLPRDELTALLEARSDGSLSARLTSEIVARADGNPFFAEELLAAAGDPRGETPPRLRDLLLQRVTRLDRQTQDLLRVAAAAGRDVAYSLLCAVAELSERDVRESLRAAVDQGVLVAEQSSGSFRFRHALLAEAIYATILPGEREELHARLAEELARAGAGSSAELAPHWAAAGRSMEALVASVDAARHAEAIFGLAEAHAHLERALELWPAVPDAAARAGVDLAELCAWAARLASQAGAATRALELGQRAIELVAAADVHRASRFHVALAEYHYETGIDDDAALAAFERAVELVPDDPPSPERAYALGSLAGGLMVARRYAQSLPIGEEALALARRVGAREAEVRAVTVLAGDLVYLARGEEGLARFREALQLAEEIGDHWGLERAYINATDALTMLGRPRESTRLGQAGLEAMRRYGINSTLLVTNQVEALLAIGEWNDADTLSADALRDVTSGFAYARLTMRAALEIGRGELDAARAHLGAATASPPEIRARILYDAYRADLALWERRFADADAAIREGLARARGREAAQTRVQLCAGGLRAEAELALLARARRDADAVDGWLARARSLVAVARRAAHEASAVTPNTAGWLALAEAEYERAGGAGRPEPWAEAAAAWQRLERPPLAAYCRWREAEALVAAGASRTEAGAPLREAHAVAERIGARPLLRELELLAQRARLDAAPPQSSADERRSGLAGTLGLTSREAEVLTLVARGYTNREIAAALVISVKTASVHVSHILRKLDAPNRREAAAIAHRVAPPPLAQP